MSTELDGGRQKIFDNAVISRVFFFFFRLEISDARGSSKSVTKSRSQLTSLLGGGEVTHAAARNWRGAGVKTIFIKE